MAQSVALVREPRCLVASHYRSRYVTRFVVCDVGAQSQRDRVLIDPKSQALAEHLCLRERFFTANIILYFSPTLFVIVAKMSTKAFRAILI